MNKRELSILQTVLVASFESPGAFPGLVDQNVTRNRSLHSDERRELTGLLHDAIRWRRRIFGDIVPSRLDEGRFVSSLAEAKELKKNVPLAKWSALSMDALARELSYPTWLVERWVKQLGFESAVSLALSMNEPAPITFRTNILKTDRATLVAKLKEEDVAVIEGKHSPWALHLTGRQNVRAFRVYKQGLFEIQDEGSQVAVLSSGAKPGQVVIDACARTGGKALALAGLMENRGSLIATDADARPLEALERRVKRSGATIIKTAWVAPDDSAPLPAFREKADLVFLDAPCSGFGTLRRKPWAKWISSAQVVDPLAAKQLTLLRRYGQWVKPGGRMSYATCTIHAPENEDVIEKFLTSEKEFRLPTEARTLRPDVEGCDGFFFCTLEKGS
jgi:16S rRNA (cytosine967-C5)-methyltransferase